MMLMLRNISLFFLPLLQYHEKEFDILQKSKNVMLFFPICCPYPNRRPPIVLAKEFPLHQIRMKKSRKMTSNLSLLL